MINSSLFLYFFIICYLLFVLLLHNMCLCITMYVLHIRMCMCMCNPGRPARCGKWFLNERISRSSEPCSSPFTLHFALRLALRLALHTEMLLLLQKSAVGPGHAKRGATCSYKNGMQFCTPQLTPTALKQHREQSI